MRKRSADQFFVAFVAGEVFIYCPNRKRFELLGWFDYRWQIEVLCEVLTEALKVADVPVADPVYLWEDDKVLKRALKQFEDPDDLNDEEVQSLLREVLLKKEQISTSDVNLK